ncbi:competence protein ComA [Pasteurellaceae bacterium LIM206]|nr:competence protein ComA [Pasteurellaceae bacterium LIM206]
MLKLRKNTTVLVPVGLHLRGNEMDVLWFDQDRQTHTFILPPEQTAGLEERINADVSHYLRHNAFTLRWIGNIAPVQIWSKSMVLPAVLSQSECEQQCRYTLQHELPVQLDEVWFDYCAYALKQGMRLDIFAVVETVVQEHLNRFRPVRLDVLDNAVHSMLRAFTFLRGEESHEQHADDTLFLYRDEQFALAVKNTTHKLLSLQRTSLKLTELFHQFCSHYAEVPAHCVAYSRVPHEEYLPSWRRVETELPLLALGAALWQCERRNEKTQKDNTALFRSRTVENEGVA